MAWLVIAIVGVIAGWWLESKTNQRFSDRMRQAFGEDWDE